MPIKELVHRSNGGLSQGGEQRFLRIKEKDLRHLKGILTGIIVLTALLLSGEVLGSDFLIYSVFRSINLGNPGETHEKDYYINMGSDHGVREGSILRVLRRVATYDLQSQQHYRDMAFSIAQIKVIHVEKMASIARLEKMLPADQTPTMTVDTLMVGDLVRVIEE